MPVCLKCGIAFKNRVVIDGKPRNLGGRKYCLTCSPYMKHNTRPIGFTSAQNCTCELCGKEYYYTRKDRRGATTKMCASCKASRFRQNIKLRAIEALGGKCQGCGYDKCVQALHFHHLDPSKKGFALSSANRGWGVIKKEIDKCVLVCANCHAEIHAGIRVIDHS